MDLEDEAVAEVDEEEARARAVVVHRVPWILVYKLECSLYIDG